VDSLSIEPGYLVQCRESKRDILLCWVVDRRLDFLYLIFQVLELLEQVSPRLNTRRCSLRFLGEPIIYDSAPIITLLLLSRLDPRALHV
jgi:hypothetical protein